MNIMIITSGLSIIKTASPFFINWIFSFMFTESSVEQSLRRQELEMRRTLNGLSIVDEFAKYAKLQRQLNKVQQDLSKAYSLRSAKFSRNRLFVNYIVQIIYAFIIVCIIWFYKSVPVVTLPAQWTIPLGMLMSWPTSVEGGISITMWLFMQESCLRTLYSKLFQNLAK